MSTTGRDEAVRSAGEVVAHAYRRLEELTPREAAEAAFTPTGPPVDELEARIRARRGLPPREAAS